VYSVSPVCHKKYKSGRQAAPTLLNPASFTQKQEL
jgi:hypothetical protein